MTHARLTRLATVGLLVATLAAGAWAAGDLVGERVKVTGTWSKNQLTADRIQRKGSGKDLDLAKITGRVERLEPRSRIFWLGPIAVDWTAKTRFEGIRSTALAAGRTVAVTGRLVAPRRMTAELVEADADLPGPRTVELSGAVTEARRKADGARVLTILGLPIRVRASQLNQASELTRNPNDRRPANQSTASVFGRPLTVGGEIGTNPRYRRGFALEGDPRDERVRVEQALQLELRYSIGDDTIVFFKLQGGYGTQFHPSTFPKAETEWTSDRGESWIYLGKLGVEGLSAQIGRQRFFEEREWWWDEELDAVRLRYDRNRLHAEVALAQELGPKEFLGRRALGAEERGVRRVIGQVAYSLDSNHRLDAFFLSHADRSVSDGPGTLVPASALDPTDANLRFCGARASGRMSAGRVGSMRYHVDLGSVSGAETVASFEPAGNAFVVASRSTRGVSGRAFDAGLSWTLDLPARPTLTLGHARATEGFRQTQIHRNNAKFGGVDRFRYYGEIFRPELSNLGVWTGALGARLLKSSSIELLHHSYSQTRPSTTLRGSLNGEPLGAKAFLGREWDLVLGIQEWEHFDIELIGGRFVAGEAFGPNRGRSAHTILGKVDFNF